MDIEPREAQETVTVELTRRQIQLIGAATNDAIQSNSLGSVHLESDEAEELGVIYSYMEDLLG